MGCHIFGHYCPAFFMSESFTETSDLQECGRLLREHELEFDHIIPRALGGTSEEHNIRLTCLKCNRKKGKKVKL